MLSKYRLPNQTKDEHIIKIVRKDIFVIFQKLMLMLLLIILPFVFFSITVVSFPHILEGELTYPFIVLLSSAFYLFVWLFFFFSFIDYYLDIWIITNKRIIDVEQNGFFSRIISEQKIANMQDVTSEAHGVLATIFKFGKVHVQTAGAKSRFVFTEVPDPDGIRDLIIKLVDTEKQKEEQKQPIQKEDEVK